MAISSFSTLKTAVADWLDRTDMSAVGGPIDDMIGLAEDKIYREMRLRFMEAATSPSAATSTGTVAIPSEFLETKQMHVLSGGRSTRLEPKSAEWIYSEYPVRSADSLPKFFAQEGDTFIFGPYPDSSYTVNLQFYAKPARLGTGNETNFLTSNAADLLLFETLLQSVGYLGMDERVPYWSAERDRAFNEVKMADQRERFGGEQSLRIASDSAMRGRR